MKTVRIANAEVLVEALRRELSPQPVNDDGWTDLHYAATFDLAEEVQRLLNEGASPNSALKTDGENLNSDVVDTLRGLGCQFETWAREGDTPLHVAAWSNSANATRVLLAAGADANASLVTGGAPLNVAARFNATETSALLLEHGARVDSKDQRGWMPLHAAAATASFETATLLLEHGADPMARVEDEQFTPLHLSVMRPLLDQADIPKVTRLLLDWGAEVNAVTKTWRATALDFAETLERPNTARVLRRHGGDTTLEAPRLVGMVKAPLGEGWGVMMPIMRQRRRRPRDRRRKRSRR